MCVYRGVHWGVPRTIAKLAALAGFLGGFPSVAHAIPAYAVQTGVPCSACHVGGFGPQLTPFGRQFKLNGYTMRAGESFVAPISAMAVVSYLRTNADQAEPPAPHYAVNDNATIDQISLFAGGGIGDHFGGFSQFTYDGVGRSFAWDNLDLRAVDHATLAGSDVVLGATLNNSPGVQDIWNTMAAWGFPYTDSALAPAPAAGTILSGALAQSTLGVSAYALWDSAIYAEAGFYITPTHGFLRAMGADPDEVGRIAGAAPYFRIAYQKDYGDANFQLGMFGFFPNLYPGGDRSTGMSDHYADIGFDGSYQFTGTGENIYEIQAILTHEHQSLDASYALGGAANAENTLNEFRLDGSYYWHNEIGGTIQYFNTWGSADGILYANSLSAKPDSSGVLLQIDGTPFGNEDAPLGGRFNLRLGIQYRIYAKFDGASTNYDGLGHNASDNDTLRIFAWLAL
jgi:hypothetical protein